MKYMLIKKPKMSVDKLKLEKNEVARQIVIVFYLILCDLFVLVVGFWLKNRLPINLILR